MTKLGLLVIGAYLIIVNWCLVLIILLLLL
jgi:hypothetical protein